MKLLILDNYDSFTYNLVHLVKKVSDCSLVVKRNDKISLEEVGEFDKILISPGPGLPSEAGILPDMIKTYSLTKSIFGVCLGLQAIGEAFGGKLINLPEVYHGVATQVSVVKPDITFQHIPAVFKIGRYHSWVVSPEGLPADLEVTAVDTAGNIMAMHHQTLDVRGVQFHPESVLTEFGEQLMNNWINH